MAFRSRCGLSACSVTYWKSVGTVGHRRGRLGDEVLVEQRAPLADGGEIGHVLGDGRVRQRGVEPRDGPVEDLAPGLRLPEDEVSPLTRLNGTPEQ